MKKRTSVYCIVGIALLILLLCTGCGSAGLNTAENREILMNHPIHSLSLETRQTHKALSGSWIAVRTLYDNENNPYWDILGCSEEVISDEVLSDIDILVIDYYQKNTAQYKSSSGRKVTGSSEHVELAYYDAHTGEFFGSDYLSAGELPEVSTTIPVKNVRISTITDLIAKRVELQLEPGSPVLDFVINDSVLTDIREKNPENYTNLEIPGTVTEISENAANAIAKFSKLKRLTIPDTVTEISLPELPEKAYLCVGKGSAAEKYAAEHDIIYCHTDNYEAFLPEGITEYDKVNFRNHPFDYIHVPSSVSYIRDGAFEKTIQILVVEPGSYAEQAALDYGHEYCYEGQLDEIYVPEGKYFFFLNEDVFSAVSVIHLPDSLTEVSDQTMGYIEDNVSHIKFAVHEGSYAEYLAKQCGVEVIYE